MTLLYKQKLDAYDVLPSMPGYITNDKIPPRYGIGSIKQIYTFEMNEMK